MSPSQKDAGPRNRPKEEQEDPQHFCPSVHLHVLNYFKGHLFLNKHCLKKWGRWRAYLFYTTMNGGSSIRRIVQQWATSTNLLYCQAAGERSIPGNGTTRRHLHRDWFSPPTQTKESPLSTDAVAQIALFKLLPALNHPNTPLMSYFIIYGFGRGKKNCKIT